MFLVNRRPAIISEVLIFNMLFMFHRVKRWLAILCCTAVLLSSASFLAYAQDANGPFPDVSSDHEYVDSIQFMLDNLVFEGYPDGTFQPDRVLNRAEQLKVYMLIHGLDPSADDYNNCFPDVKDEWFARFICLAEAMGWVEGYPDGMFRPEQEVNKVEALKMLGEIQGWQLPTPETMPFSDTPSNLWYSPYLSYAASAGLLVEKSGNFSPGDGLPRAYTAEILFRSLALYALGEDVYSAGLDEEIKAVVVADLPPPVVDLSVVDADVAEFGDAPEDGPAGYAGSYNTVQAAFPTLLNTPNSVGPGAHTLDASMEYLGDPADGDLYSYEADADDLSDPDGIMNLVNTDDFDDGVNGLNIILSSIPPPATLTAEVTVAAGAPDGPRYLNVLIDLNMDGEWSGAAGMGEREWAVQNFAVNVAPGSTEVVTTDAFAYSNGNILTPTAWMRVLLTRSPLDVGSYGADGWDGSGQFEFGEVEDYYLQLPQWDDGQGGKGGGPGGPGAGGRGLIWGKPAPLMVCPKKVVFPDGVNWVNFRCLVFNLGGAGDVKYNLWRIMGGVNVLPVTGTFAMPTAPPGFGIFGVVGNPSAVRFVAWPRAGTPSTWGYTVVGIDPESTVDEDAGTVDLGLVPGEDDEGYEAGDDVSEVTSWADGLADGYIYGDAIEGPKITDVTLMEMDDTDPGVMYHWRGYAHVRHPTMENGNMSYEWDHFECGDFQVDGQMFDWWFSDADHDICVHNGFELTVSDGDFTDTQLFNTDLYIPLEEPVEPPPENQLPILEGISAVWTNNMEDDPHIYDLGILAEDPDGDPLTFNWTNVDCGFFHGATDGQSVSWRYALADMEMCGAAEVTVEVGDGVTTVEDTFQVFP